MTQGLRQLGHHVEVRVRGRCDDNRSNPPLRVKFLIVKRVIKAIIRPAPDVVLVRGADLATSVEALTLHKARNVPYVVWTDTAVAMPGGITGLILRLAVRSAGRVVVDTPTPSTCLKDLRVPMGKADIVARVGIDGAGSGYVTNGSTPRETRWHDAAHLLRTLERARPQKPWRMSAKRALDVVGSAAVIVLASIPLVVLASTTATFIGRPVLFRQTRPGLYGQPFQMIKFRTMTEATDNQGDLLPDALRLTPYGRFLRATSLDELPSLVNVLSGQMSFVGPRPLLFRYIPWFTETELQRLDVRPGITGLAQVSGRNTTTWDDRLAFDVSYVQKLSLRKDARLIVATLVRVFERSGVVVDPVSIMKDLDEERKSRIISGGHR
ncbi:sugar transferase [Frigoribacterium sp. PhB24]|uniref:sugar transferase n=1 Tax=Frigoribacterium sp. PhB24 TaxID=2485204 RepID=UPI0018F6666D|nr:sugar transferase [Frigoribacterium sp. PhB24]